MIVTRCCLCMTVPKAAWHLVANWMFLSRRPKRASAPGSVFRTWTVEPRRPRTPTRTWTLSTRTASGQEKTNASYPWKLKPPKTEWWCVVGYERGFGDIFFKYSYENPKTNDMLLLGFLTSQTIFQPNLCAGRRKKPVHQILYHWYGWRNGHLGCQGNTQTDTDMQDCQVLTTTVISHVCQCLFSLWSLPWRTWR